MIIQTEQYVLVSADDNRYWADCFPDWAGFATFIACVNGPAVIEPHYHDNDEFWLWISGEGRARLDHGPEAPFTPGTVVYCPMGAIHEFVSPTVQHNIGVTTHLVRQRRAAHLHVEEDGEPVRTAEASSWPEPTTWGHSHRDGLAARWRSCGWWRALKSNAWPRASPSPTSTGCSSPGSLSCTCLL